MTQRPPAEPDPHGEHCQCIRHRAERGREGQPPKKKRRKTVDTDEDEDGRRTTVNGNARCRYDGKPLHVKIGRGRKPEFCNAKCRKAFFLQRTTGMG